MMDADEIKRRICESLPDAQVEITDLAGDGNHYKAVVRSAVFAGKNRVAQHKLVYNAIGTDMGTTLHALALETKPL